MIDPDKYELEEEDIISMPLPFSAEILSVETEKRLQKLTQMLSAEALPNDHVLVRIEEKEFILAPSSKKISKSFIVTQKEFAPMTDLKMPGENIAEFKKLLTNATEEKQDEKKNGTLDNEDQSKEPLIKAIDSIIEEIAVGRKPTKRKKTKRDKETEDTSKNQENTKPSA
eukprot:TRINITY_DN2118_c0_g6_i5.p1 TRINITY_DN2118_c0_g6~~TRINITY_DN2118_c0_g6_i5.p1  ORF type:complete len:170 (-),score=56.77 TRINITY_DN2118_c0_g6_i5:131-640(-)